MGDEDEAEEEKQREEKQVDGDSGEDAEMEAEPAEDPLASYTQRQLTEALVEMLLPGGDGCCGAPSAGGAWQVVRRAS